MYSCHTTCDLLNAGTFESELRTIGEWLRANPYDVVTFLIVNSDQKEAKYFVDPIQNSGVSEFLYEPAHVPQNRDQWPTLGEMIITGKRLVIFMDYKAQQHKIPYILNEFTHMWETPFSPTDRAFPCTLQRPPHLGEQKAMEDFMYLANHNLDVAIDLGALTGTSSSEAILIPNTAVINMTNGRYDTYGQLEAMTLNCTSEPFRPSCVSPGHVVLTSASRTMDPSPEFPPGRLLQLRRPLARLGFPGRREGQRRHIQSAVLRHTSECGLWVGREKMVCRCGWGAGGRGGGMVVEDFSMLLVCGFVSERGVLMTLDRVIERD